ncbi:MAG: DsbA family oxidoreductase [Actinomyces sp.]|nr:DsbA family oxidoreductase [Actinomyces sp.]MCI1788528.1 DsbA family oxidoreductase [Actinomyces sp.]
MKIELWADVVCPWCGLTNHRLDLALSRFEHADEVEVIHRSFELNPDAPIGTPEPTARFLHRARGVDEGQITRSFRLVEGIAHDEGITEYHVSDNVIANTSLAHQFLAYASEKGRHGAAWHVAFDSYFGRRVPIWTIEDMLALAARLGLDPGETRTELESGRYLAAVQADRDEAFRLGANGVPFIVIDRRYAIPGSQKPKLLLRAIRQAWTESQA